MSLSKSYIDNIEYTTKDGEKIKLKDMTDRHLENAYRYAVRTKQYIWAKLFLSEKLIRRGVYGDDEFCRVSPNDYKMYI